MKETMIRIPKKILINKDRDRFRVDAILEEVNPIFINEFSKEIIAKPMLIGGCRCIQEIPKGMWEESFDELNSVNEVIHEVRVNKLKAYELARRSLNRENVQSIFDEKHCFYLGEYCGYNLGIWISDDHCSASLTILKIGDLDRGYHSLGIVRDEKVLKSTFDGWDFNSETELTKLNKEVYRRSIECGFLFPEY